MLGALIGIGRHGPEVDRLAGGPVLLGEFGIGQVGVGGAWRHRGQITLAEQRRHRLAAAAGHRPDGSDHRGVGDHFAGIGRCLRGIVLPGGRCAIIQAQHPQFVAADAALGVGFLYRQHRTCRIVVASSAEAPVSALRPDEARECRRAEQGEGGAAGNTHQNLPRGAAEHLLRPSGDRPDLDKAGQSKPYATTWPAAPKSMRVTMIERHGFRPRAELQHSTDNGQWHSTPSIEAAACRFRRRVMDQR